MYVIVFDLMVVTPQDLCSSIEKGETRTPSCHTRAIIRVQPHAEEEQADASGVPVCFGR